jgi:hypothetical protein
VKGHNRNQVRVGDRQVSILVGIYFFRLLMLQKNNMLHAMCESFRGPLFKIARASTLKNCVLDRVHRGSSARPPGRQSWVGLLVDTKCCKLLLCLEAVRQA